MRLFRLWILWLLLFIGPMLPPDWLYWPAFHFLNALTSLILILAVTRSYRVWWAKLFCGVALLQIYMNAYDAIIPISWEAYANMQNFLNSIEFLLLFGAGGFAELRNWNAERNRDAGRSSGSSASGRSGARG